MERLTSEGLQVDFQVAVPSAAARREISSGNNTKKYFIEGYLRLRNCRRYQQKQLNCSRAQREKKKPLHRSHPQHF